MPDKDHEMASLIALQIAAFEQSQDQQGAHMAHGEKLSQGEDRGKERAKGDLNDLSTGMPLISESMITLRSLRKTGFAVPHEMSSPRLNRRPEDTDLYFVNATTKAAPT